MKNDGIYLLFISNFMGHFFGTLCRIYYDITMTNPDENKDNTDIKSLSTFTFTLK